MAEGLNTISVSLHQANEVTQSSLDSLHAARVAEERLEILKWLSPIDPSVNLNASLRVRQPNTGLWFLESQDFAEWIKSPHTLWLHGIRRFSDHLNEYDANIRAIAGCGKTVLCSTIIEAIEEVCAQSDAQQIAYFFFDFQNSDKHDASFMMCSLIRQLSAVELEIPEAARAMYLKCHATGHSPTLEELIATFTSVVCASSRDTFIILDALDEVPAGPPRRETLGLMKRLTSVAPDKLRLLVASRDESDIRHVLEEIADKVIRLQNEDMGIGTSVLSSIKCFRTRGIVKTAHFIDDSTYNNVSWLLQRPRMSVGYPRCAAWVPSFYFISSLTKVLGVLANLISPILYTKRDQIDIASANFRPTCRYKSICPSST